MQNFFKFGIGLLLCRMLNRCVPSAVGSYHVFDQDAFAEQRLSSLCNNFHGNEKILRYIKHRMHVRLKRLKCAMGKDQYAYF